MRVVAVVVLLVLCAAPAHAATGTYLRLGHLSAEPAQVDITLVSIANPSAPVRVPNVGYGTLLDYRRIEPGDYTITMHTAGADPNSTPLTTTKLLANDGKAYTAVDLAKSLKVLEDDISLPPAGLARLRVLNGAGAQVDVVRGGTALARDTGSGTATGYEAIASGTDRLQVLPRGGTPVNVDANIEPGGVYTVLVTDGSAALRTDAKGAEIVPGGGQETGFGGMAPGVDWRMVALASLLVVGCLTYFRRRLFRFG